MTSAFWDERYAAPGYLFGEAPNRFLVSQQGLFRPGQRVLAVADGEGRNGVWLARQGMRVLSVDSSPVALDKARKLAERNGAQIEFELADLRSWAWGEHRFDAVVAIFIQFATPEERAVLHRAMKKTLKPGGYLVLQGYTPKQLEYRTGGPPDADKLYTAAMLREDFGDMEILHLREHEEEICEGCGHCGMSALVDLVARKKTGSGPA
jgi:cyclopropane fatty-acyl-phospholipid synthase-like methyltransferase